MNILSPYALLQASKPRKPNTVTTTYDLYSAAQSQNHQDAQQTLHPDALRKAAQEKSEPAPAPERAVPVRKTHYISDIQKRHNAAAKRSTFSPL